MKTYREFLEMINEKYDEVVDYVAAKKVEYMDGYPDAVVQLWMHEDGELDETYNASPISLTHQYKRCVEIARFNPGWAADYIDQEESNIIRELYPDVDSWGDLDDEQKSIVHEKAVDGLKNIEMYEYETVSETIDYLRQEAEFEELRKE